MRRYETVFILRPDLGEAQTKDTIKRFEGIVSGNAGELIETDEWGVRELAYRIRGERRGHYVRLDYIAPEITTHEVERNLKLADPVLRYLSVLVDEHADVAKARAEVEANRQRIAQNRDAAEAAMQARAARDRGETAPASAIDDSIPDAPEGLAELEASTEPESEG